MIFFFFFGSMWKLTLGYITLIMVPRVVSTYPKKHKILVFPTMFPVCPHMSPNVFPKGVPYSTTLCM
jgi:hypothetical protein